MPDLSQFNDIEVDRKNRIIVIVLREESEAVEIADSFGPNDLFRRDLLDAVAEVWPG